MKHPEPRKTGTVAELQDELRRRDERIAELRKELIEAGKLVDDMKEQIADGNALIDSWIEAFDMNPDENGVWGWLGDHRQHWQEVEKTENEYRALIREWNKMVPVFNAGLVPVGRPLAASQTQVADVKTRRKRGESLRGIAAATGLGFGTVRTIVAKDQGKDPTSVRRRQMRKLELDRVRAAEYRARKKLRDGLPKRITGVRKRGDELVLRAKGLGKGLV